MHLSSLLLILLPVLSFALPFTNVDLNATNITSFAAAAAAVSSSSSSSPSSSNSTDAFPLPLADSLQVRVADPKIIEMTDHLLYEVSVDEFMAASEQPEYAMLIWETDGCTHAPNTILNAQFLHSCERHDFGIYNLQHQGRWDQFTKDKIDRNFYADLIAECKWRPGVFRLACDGAAYIYYKAVVKYGG